MCSGEDIAVINWTTAAIFIIFDNLWGVYTGYFTVKIVRIMESIKLSGYTHKFWMSLGF